MAGTWYSILMSLSGTLVLGCIVLTWLIRRKIEVLNGCREPSSLLLITGGLLTSLGFAWGVLSGHEMNGWMLSLILTGPAMIGYALFWMGFKGVSGRLLIQSTIILLSLLLAGHYASVQTDIAYVGPFLAVLLLMNSQITITRGRNRGLLIASSWIITAFSWARYLLDDTTGLLKFAIVLPYFLAVASWVYVLISLYTSISPGRIPLPGNAQEGL